MTRHWMTFYWQSLNGLWQTTSLFFKMKHVNRSTGYLVLLDMPTLTSGCRPTSTRCCFSLVESRYTTRPTVKCDLFVSLMKVLYRKNKLCYAQNWQPHGIYNKKSCCMFWVCVLFSWSLFGAPCSHVNACLLPAFRTIPLENLSVSTWRD